MAIDAVVEEVAENLEEAAEVTRSINTAAVSYFIGGVAFGVALGFYFGYRFNKEKVRAEAFKESEAEIAKMREVYQQKTIAAEPKPTVEEVMEERGYSTAAPERPLKAPVPVQEPSLVPPREQDRDWDWTVEVEARNEEEPYVIHQDEFRESENGYSKVTYTYYAGDDVMMDEDNEHPLPHADAIVGRNNLKWGHEQMMKVLCSSATIVLKSRWKSVVIPVVMKRKW